MDSDDSDSTTLAAQGGIGIIGTAFKQAMGFVFILVITRLATKTEFGLYTLGLAIVMYAQQISSLNISTSIDYFIPKFLSSANKNLAKGTFVTATWISIIGSLAGVIFLITVRNQLASIFDEPRLAYILLLFVPYMLLKSLNNIIKTTFQALKKMQYQVYTNSVLLPGGKVLLTAVFLIIGFNQVGIILGHITALLISIFIGVIILYYKFKWIFTIRSQRISARRMLSYSAPLTIAGVVLATVSQIDYLVIGAFTDASDIGVYRAAYQLATLLWIILRGVSPIFKPMVAENQGDIKQIGTNFRNATRWVTMITIPIAVVFLLAPEIYLSTLFTEAYKSGVSPFILLVMGFYISAAVGPAGMVLQGLGHTRYFLLNSFILVLINGALDILFVPRYGIVGAGIGTAIALLILSIIEVAEIYYLYNIHPFQSNLIRIYLTAASTGLVGFLTTRVINDNLLVFFILPILTMTVYITILNGIGGFNSKDYEIARLIDAKLGRPLFQTFIVRNHRS